MPKDRWSKGCVNVLSYCIQLVLISGIVIIKKGEIVEDDFEVYNSEEDQIDIDVCQSIIMFVISIPTSTPSPSLAIANMPTDEEVPNLAMEDPPLNDRLMITLINGA